LNLNVHEPLKTNEKRLHAPSTSSTFLPANSSAIALSFRRTFFFLLTVSDLAFRRKKATTAHKPHLLPGHDKCPADIPVLDESLAVRQAERLREIERGNARRVGHGDDDVDGDVTLREHAAHLDG
jgi:hypothetical protein